ncbi:MAG: hypothetical protein LBU89_14560 [Fibromonadaceae bacterium]|jgi:hypothetical protein|nr:hypothetical protein [Fibromonadaceae bacterium]
MKKYFYISLLLVSNALAQSVSFSGGANCFLGSLQKEIEPAPYLGAGFELELSYYTIGYSHATFSYLKLKKNRDFHGLYQFLGRAGIETSEHLFEFASIGVGISLATVRGNAATPAAENYMLNTSESNFGWNARLKINILKMEKFTVGTLFYYDKILTLPNSSHLLQGGMFVGI